MRLLLLFAAFPLLAANFYVRDGATGSFDGSDWTNAYDDLPATLNRGDTYYIADGNYAAYTFDDATSGTTLITIKKAIEADHGTDTGWNSTYGDGQATFSALDIESSYWVIDGQVGYGATWWKDYTAYGFVLDIAGCSNTNAVETSQDTLTDITFTRWEIKPCDNTNGSGDTFNLSLRTTDNMTFSYMWLHAVNRVHFFWGRITEPDNVDGLVFEYNFVEANGIAGPTTGDHSEISAARGTIKGIIRFSVFKDWRSTGGWIIGNGTGWEFYGNVFWWDGFSSATGNNGAIGTWSSDVDYNVQDFVICNNTFYNITQPAAATLIPIVNMSSGHNAENNLWVEVATPVDDYFGGSVAHNYNAEFNADGLGTETNGESLASNPLTDPDNGDFTLSSATAHGNSTGVCSAFNTDMDGNTRGADGTWDRGAFELNEGVPQALRIPVRLSMWALWIVFGLGTGLWLSLSFSLLTRPLT